MTETRPPEVEVMISGFLECSKLQGHNDDSPAICQGRGCLAHISLLKAKTQNGGLVNCQSSSRLACYRWLCLFKPPKYAEDEDLT